MNVTGLIISESRFQLVNSGGNPVTYSSTALLLYNGGTVCDDGFSDNSANAICKEMGFSSASSWSNANSWPSLQDNYQTKLDDVICSSTSWGTCARISGPGHDCSHSEDVFLRCSGSTVRCGPGRYRSSSTCTMRPTDRYKAHEGYESYKDEGMLTCTACPSDTTSSAGSSHCSCQAGMYWSGEGCQNCTQGSVSQEAALQCQECPAGSTSLQGGNSCGCPPGLIWSWDVKIWGSCKDCLPGTYKDEEMLTCTACPLNTTSLKGSGYCFCHEGMHWNKTRCENCTQGSVSLEGALQCQECSSGSTALNNAPFCSCPIGQIWKWDGDTNSSCTPCQRDTYKGESMATCAACPAFSSSDSGSAVLKNVSALLACSGTVPNVKNARTAPSVRKVP